MRADVVSAPPAAPGARALPRFQSRSALRSDLKLAVDAYFLTTGLSRQGAGTMLFKSATFFAWASSSYLLLVFWATTWWTAAPLAVSLGLALAGIGFSVMHDGGHASYSSAPRSAAEPPALWI
ncbi:MAG: hypothetical protein R3F62_20995 [Planctomycetota bacterium]